MILIGLVGHIASGKTTVASHLVRNYNFKELRFAERMRLILGTLRLPQVRKNYHRLGSKLREMDSTVWIHPVNEEIDELYGWGKYDRFVISDVRYPNEAAYIAHKGGTLLGLHSDLATLHHRVVNRQRDLDENVETMDDFLQLLSHESEVYIDGLFTRCNLVIDSSGTIEEMLGEVDKFAQGREITMYCN